MSYLLKEFGSYTVGGRVNEITEGESREVNYTESTKYYYDPRGHFSVEHAYVQYFVPENRNHHPPMLLVHGGGMHGSTWETTPDGRPGWLNLMVARGFEVHVLDNVERGRSGFAPGLWHDEPILRSQEEAWRLFRIGSKENFAQRLAFDGALFPVTNFSQFSRMIVPRWLSTTTLHISALLDTLKRIGPAIVMCHSQGGEIALKAAQQAPDLFAGLIAIEPSAAPENIELTPSIPTVIFAGDYLNAEAHWVLRSQQWQQWIEDVSKLGVEAGLIKSGVDCSAGHSHFPMLDKKSENALEKILQLFESFRATDGKHLN